MSKLFKPTKELVNLKEYQEYIEDGLKPLGFGEDGDELFYSIKVKLFNSLYQLAKNSGASFDTEIYFDSVIGDLKETFDEVNPSLLKLQDS